MGLMDRVKEQAALAAQRATQATQEAAQQGKAKLDQAQAKRRQLISLHRQYKLSQLGHRKFAEISLSAMSRRTSPRRSRTFAPAW